LPRYRTPRKKTTNWKGHLGAGAVGLVLAALGLFLLMNPPPEPEETAGETARDTGTETSSSPPADQPNEPAESPEGPEPGLPPGAAGDMGRAFFGLALTALGVLLPVASVVIEKTSGKKWKRRAGKKHPFKKKL
jgi:hypothetical protein